jgi:hypothetical protein
MNAVSGIGFGRLPYGKAREKTLAAILERVLRNKTAIEDIGNREVKAKDYFILGDRWTLKEIKVLRYRIPTRLIVTTNIYRNGLYLGSRTVPNMQRSSQCLKH